MKKKIKLLIFAKKYKYFFTVLPEILKNFTKASPKESKN